MLSSIDQGQYMYMFNESASKYPGVRCYMPTGGRDVLQL